MNDGYRVVILDRWTKFTEEHPNPTDAQIEDWLKFCEGLCGPAGIAYDDLRKAVYKMHPIAAQ